MVTSIKGPDYAGLNAAGLLTYRLEDDVIDRHMDSTHSASITTLCPGLSPGPLARSSRHDNPFSLMLWLAIACNEIQPTHNMSHKELMIVAG